MSLRVEEYIREDGSIPYLEWFETLDAQAAAKVTVAVVRLAMGNTSNVKWFDGMGEYRLDWGPGYRIYLAKDGEQLIVLFGGGKQKKAAGRHRAREGAVRRIQGTKKSTHGSK
jgi:putative addiction module killer protein